MELSDMKAEHARTALHSRDSLQLVSVRMSILKWKLSSH
jgi:hypothetical protein